MKAIYKQLVDKSLAASLSAIEIYNKPDFKYRNEIFVILLINSWELLLKARILQNNKNKTNSLYLYNKNGRIKRNRTGNPFTIEIIGSMKLANLENIIKENLEILIEIRDTSIHFYNNDSIAYIIYSLGAAALKNYSTKIKEWFEIDIIKKYNFNILPLGFAYNFQTFDNISFDGQPSAIKNIILSLQNTQQNNLTEKDGYYLVCEIKTELSSAKKISSVEGISLKIDNLDPNATVTIVKKQKTIDLYPYSQSEIRDILKKTIKNFNQNSLNDLIKNEKIKDNQGYSSYSFKSKKDEEEYKMTKKVKSGTSSLYNEFFVQYAISSLN